ncbi:MAG: hypothetical protein A2Z93_00520 [Curvibacter sp. GWA2_64_110]|nr:MAG: hypothetical protein A2Z93_00520 [Curvibacter sp. GWA2_64_110]HCY17091.1 hypothetical protein [Curvibacter sp.]
MRCRLAPALLCLASSLAVAQEAPAPAKPPPPRWRHATAVTVVIGADVAPSFEGQLPVGRLILRVHDLGALALPVQGASECVIEAEATANLSSERVLIRPRLQRCFDAQGKEFPSRNVSGFAVDKDAHTGIKGTMTWSANAKELLLLGVGSQARPGYFSRLMTRTLSPMTLGLSDEYLNKDESKPGPDPDTAREIRGVEALLPTLTLEPGRQFDLVLSSRP